MPGIFVSYRWADSAGHTGRLQEFLRKRYGRKRVFRDIETLEGGVDFRAQIREVLPEYKVVLAVIGRGWADARDDAGRRRLDDEEDLVRIEVATALAMPDVLLLPVLVGGATMPSKTDLPPDLSRLADRKAIELSDQRWNYDCRQLAERVDPVVRPRHYAWWYAGITAATVIASVAWAISRQDDAPARVEDQLAGDTTASRSTRGSLTIHGQPPEMLVAVRAESVLRPMDRPQPVGDSLRLDLEPGPYWVVGRATDHRTDSTRITVAAGSAHTATIQLRPLPGPPPHSGATLVLGSTPPGLEIVLNDTMRAGRTPQTLTLPAGSYEVLLRGRDPNTLANSRGFFFQSVVTLSRGERRELSPTILEQSLTKLDVQDPIAGARYFIVDGSEAQEFDPVRTQPGIYLLPGRYVLRRRDPTAGDQRLSVRPGEATIPVTFSRER